MVRASHDLDRERLRERRGDALLFRHLRRLGDDFTGRLFVVSVVVPGREAVEAVARPALDAVEVLEIGVAPPRALPRVLGRRHRRWRRGRLGAHATDVAVLARDGRVVIEANAVGWTAGGGGGGGGVVRHGQQRKHERRRRGGGLLGRSQVVHVPHDDLVTVGVADADVGRAVALASALPTARLVLIAVELLPLLLHVRERLVPRATAVRGGVELLQLNRANRVEVSQEGPQVGDGKVLAREQRRVCVCVCVAVAAAAKAAAAKAAAKAAAEFRSEVRVEDRVGSRECSLALVRVARRKLMSAREVAGRRREGW